MREIYETDEQGRPTGVSRQIADNEGRPLNWAPLAPPIDIADPVWRDGMWATFAPAVISPETVTMRQAKIQLSRASLLAKANAAIEAMEGQAGEEARLEWEYATELRRDHPLVAGIGRALGLDDAAKDDLFRQAAAIA